MKTDRLYIFRKTGRQVKRRPDFFLAPVFVAPAGNTAFRHENDTVRLPIPGKQMCNKRLYHIFRQEARRAKEPHESFSFVNRQWVAGVV